MKYITFHTDYDLKIAILAFDLDYQGMLKNYIQEGLIAAGADPSIDREVIAYQLPSVFSANGKKRKALPVKEQREYLEELLQILEGAGIEHIIVTQPDYFKTLTGQAKAALEAGALYSPDEAHFSAYAKMRVTYAPNQKMVFYDPEKTVKGIRLASQAVVADRNNAYEEPGTNIIKSMYFPQTFDEIKRTLYLLLGQEELTCDIEGFSLKHHDAGIATIAFAWNKHEGVAFQVDWAPGFIRHDVRELLIDFFRERHHQQSRGHKRKLIWHNAGYDLTVLIYQLATHSHGGDWDFDDLFDWLTDTAIMEDTKIISYLATNSCAGNKLGLKEQAVEFAGNYAVDDIKDVTKIPIRELLEYNLIDALSTWYVYEKNTPRMIQDQQEQIYREIFIPSLVDVIDMQLNGLPVDVEQVQKSKVALQDIRQKALDLIQGMQIVKDYTHHLKELEVEKLHAKWKKKRTTVAEISLDFNPDSDSQLAGLLYDPAFLGLPVLGKTDSGAPSTKGVYIKDLRNHTQDPAIIDFLNAVIDLKDCGILLSTFIPALEGARKAPDGNYYMHGNFNLGGTVSGRLSSSDPNLQNIPAKSRLSKYIKICIKAPDGWLFVGLDFDSLEDKISALITKDPNKLKVYTDGYDGHCLRAYSYFGETMPDIDGNNVDSINSIAKKYPVQRQNSKAPTFLLTYGGTYHGLMGNCGFDVETALQIETNYHKLYRVSDEWVADKIDYATKNGYVEVAFGLRVRTPILHQVVMTERHTPYAAKAESRTAGNALGQSWGLLNNRAASEFMRKVRSDVDRRRDIKICCQIHDAQYYLIRADVKVLHWFNKTLTECVKWQKHPAIAHPDVKLSGAVSIFYPTWSEEHSIPNDATEEFLLQKAQEIVAEAV